MRLKLALVSVIIPCYNEQKTIRLLLDALYKQTIGHSNLEIIISDAMSIDQTRAEIQKFQTENPDMKIMVVDNKKQTIPAALNEALNAADGEFIVRLDAHSIPAENYVQRCVEALKSGAGDNVGGVWEIQPGENTWIAKSIAIAASHPLGVGDALYRYTTRACEVDTVPFGSYKKVLFEKIGLYDESLLANEDYEMNTRIRLIGGKIWLDPEIRSKYFARSNISSLSKQYWRYGTWKWIMLRRYPKTLRWRQALPPLFVLSVVCLLLLAIFLPPAGWLLLAELLAYFGILAVVSLPLALRGKDLRLAFGIPLAITTMHFSWGSGFIWSMIKNIGK
jgi:glycosyltransferase involved in cell wall biosynthesis